MPKRIQRQRTKGWRMPEGAVYVGRPTRWGNPWRVEPFMGGWSVDANGHEDVYEDKTAAMQRAVDQFRSVLLLAGPDYPGLAPLRGHDLACWCQLDQPCHADVLIDLANR